MPSKPPDAAEDIIMTVGRSISVMTPGSVTAIASALLVGAAQLGGQNPITLDDIRQLSSTPWLGITPDGGTVAYLLNTPGASPDLWLVPFGGGAPSRLTENIAIRSVVGWNGPGDQLAFVAPDGEQSALWTVRRGAAPRVACRTPRGARSAAWLADGARLTFSARLGSDTPGEAVFLCDARDGVVTQVAPKGYFAVEFAWSPGGEWPTRRSSSLRLDAGDRRSGPDRDGHLQGPGSHLVDASSRQRRRMAV